MKRFEVWHKGYGSWSISDAIFAKSISDLKKSKEFSDFKERIKNNGLKISEIRINEIAFVTRDELAINKLFLKMKHFKKD